MDKSETPKTTTSKKRPDSKSYNDKNLKWKPCMRELCEVCRQAYNLRFYENQVLDVNVIETDGSANKIGILHIPGDKRAFFFDINKELHVVKNSKAKLGQQLLNALEKAEGCLSLEDFCQICLLDSDDAWKAMQKFDPEKDRGGLFTWLIFEYGIESVGEDWKEGVLFGCILESVLAEVRKSPAVRAKFREKFNEVFKICGDKMEGE